MYIYEKHVIIIIDTMPRSLLSIYNATTHQESLIKMTHLRFKTLIQN